MQEPSASRQLCQEMMTEPDAFAVWPDVDLKPVRHDNHTIPSRRRCTVSLQPVVQEGQDEPHPEDWAKFEGEGASTFQDAHEKMESGHTSPDTCLSKCIPAEFKGVEEGGGIAPSPLDYQSDNSTSDSEAGLVFSPGGVSLDGGIGMGALPAGEPVIKALPTLAVVPHHLTVSPHEINANVKRQLMKGIRQLGQKHEGIFELLEQVQGPLEVRKQFVEFTIKEAARFKRQHLIKKLEKMLEKIVSDICFIEEGDM